MRHAREDHNRIQDPAGLIPDDEPVFLLRGQDALAPAVVREWAFQAEAEGVDPLMVERARQHADRMEAWHVDHGKKIPDMPA